MDEASRQFMAELQGKLNQYFSGEEIETLAFVLGVDYDALRGATKPTKINSLIYATARNGRLATLLNEARRQRPNVEWPDAPDGFTLPQGGEAEAATVYQIHTGSGPFIGSMSGGEVITGPKNVGGDEVKGNKYVAGDEIKGSKYVMSGDFRGAILNIESRLDHVTQTLGAATHAAPDQRATLASLVEELKGTLATVGPEQMPDAETLARRVGALVDEATATRPDPETVSELGEIVRRAAAKLSTAAPRVMTLIAAIIEQAAGLVGRM